MSKVRFKLDYAGVGELLRSQEMSECMHQIAQEKASDLPAGYATDTWTGKRAIASVYTESGDAYNDNLRNNTLLRIIS